jgi:hypothetical protein
MPHRLVSVAILVGWAVASGLLFSRDVLPDLMIGSPPDLRTVALADEGAKPTRWAILVADDPGGLQLRAVGQAKTLTERKSDGWVRMTSFAWFDAGELVKGTPISVVQNDRLEVRAMFDVDASGNLEEFLASVRLAGSHEDLLRLAGRVQGNRLEVQSQAVGQSPILNWTRTFPYQPRGLVQNALGPMERMPGLQVGQRWESKVISPITGQVQKVAVEVAGRRLITWDGNPVWTLEVVTHMLPWTARTWVRRDGLVLRQEVPFPLARLYLERQGENATAGGIEPGWAAPVQGRRGAR